MGRRRGTGFRLDRLASVGRYLIDTHALLWASGRAERLGNRAAEILATDDAVVYVSIGTFWELAIKQSIGKLSVAEDYCDAVLAAGYSPLPIQLAHINRYRALPLHHRDPFDRLLVAQAQVEKLTVITQDEAFHRYEVPVVW